MSVTISPLIARREKISYAVGDTASNLVFQTIMLYIAFFYTDVYGLSASEVAVLLLSVRIIDAVTDPIMGVIADRTQTKWGNYRPYILWGAIPFAISCVLCFITPDWNHSLKLLYAYLSYNLLMLTYTFINVPYAALGGVLSSDSNEQVSIQSYRFTGAMAGGLFVAFGVEPLTSFFGSGDIQKGFFWTMCLMAVIGCGLFFASFWGTKERVKTEVPSSFEWRQLSHLLDNPLWVLLCLLAVLGLIANVAKTTLAVYYARDYLSIGSVSLFVGLGMVANLAGCVLAGLISRYASKKSLFLACNLLAALISFIAYFIDPGAWVIGLIVYILWCFVYQISTPVFWAFIADAAKQSETQTDSRQTGLVYSTVIFFIKIGLAIGGAVAAGVLTMANYESTVELSVSGLQTLNAGFTILPGLVLLIVSIITYNSKEMARY